MRRVLAKHAKPGMVLTRPVYDGRGKVALEKGTHLTDQLLTALESSGVGELIIEDHRMADVPVQPLIAPELEAEAVRGLRAMMAGAKETLSVDEKLLEMVEHPIAAMAADFFPEVVGEPNIVGCLNIQDYNYVQPVKVAGLSMLVGKRSGLDETALTNLGVAAVLMNVGYLTLASKSASGNGALGPDAVKKHPEYGCQVLSALKGLSPELLEAILQHHERWNGSGYEKGLRAKEIGLFARVLAIADAYYELVSKRPGRDELIPHQAVEYIMAYGGDFFDPELVQVFARQVPLYATGLTVRLSTGESGVISDPNYGYIGRPVVRIFYDRHMAPVDSPYELDLSLAHHQDRLVAQLMEE